MIKYRHLLHMFFAVWFFFNPANSIAHNSSSETKTLDITLFKLVGEGTMHWFWLDIYHAELSTPSGIYEHQQWPLSLELIYARHITRENLLQATEEEWKRQSIQYQQQWLTQLNDIWPDIAPKDKLLLEVDSEGSSHFFYNNQHIGSLIDKAFAFAFTAIWLSSNTLKPDLRDQLIGLRQ